MAELGTNGDDGHGEMHTAQVRRDERQQTGPRTEQTRATDDNKRPDEEAESGGSHSVTGTGGRREYSVKAGKNMVQEQLVQEIVRVALE